MALAAARLGGLAIAMVTIALPIVGVPLAKRLSDFTGGSQGMSARFAEAPEGTGLYDDQWQLYIVLVIGGIVFLLTRNLVRGKYGRAFAIVKGNENVASSMGISPYRYKVLAFTIASLIGGVSGFLYMVVIQYTSPETMSFGHSISLVAAMVIGGAGSIVGSILGGAYYVLVPQLTNAVDPNLTALLQGAILLVVLFVLPGGLVSLPRALTPRTAALRAPRAAPPRHRPLRRRPQGRAPRRRNLRQRGKVTHEQAPSIAEGARHRRGVGARADARRLRPRGRRRPQRRRGRGSAEPRHHRHVDHARHHDPAQRRHGGTGHLHGRRRQGVLRREERRRAASSSATARPARSRSRRWTTPTTRRRPRRTTTSSRTTSSR